MIEALLRLSPLWLPTLLFFIPLTVKTASGEELKKSISSFIAGLGCFFFFVSFCHF